MAYDKKIGRNRVSIYFQKASTKYSSVMVMFYRAYYEKRHATC